MDSKNCTPTIFFLNQKLKISGYFPLFSTYFPRNSGEVFCKKSCFFTQKKHRQLTEAVGLRQTIYYLRTRRNRHFDSWVIDHKTSNFRFSAFSRWKSHEMHEEYGISRGKKTQFWEKSKFSYRNLGKPLEFPGKH